MVSLRATQTRPLPSETFSYCRQRLLSSAMERSSCHCHRASSALTNTREWLPGLIPLPTVVTRTMSLLLEQLFLLFSIFFCYRSHVYTSKGSYARMNRLWFTRIMSDSSSEAHSGSACSISLQMSQKGRVKSTVRRAWIKKQRNTWINIKPVTAIMLNTAHPCLHWPPL